MKSTKAVRVFPLSSQSSGPVVWKCDCALPASANWSARNAAYLGASVVGVDIADHLLEAARTLSAHVKPPIDFRHADAEALPFDEASFDAVVSTFGVMFAPNQDAAAGELLRVCRSGGTLR